MYSPLTPRRAADHIVSRCRSALKIDKYALVVNNIVVTLISAYAVGTFCFEIFCFIFNRGLAALLKLGPYIKIPSVGVVDIKPLCRIKTFINKRAVKQASCSRILGRIL